MNNNDSLQDVYIIVRPFCRSNIEPNWKIILQIVNAPMPGNCKTLQNMLQGIL